MQFMQFTKNNVFRLLILLFLSLHLWNCAPSLKLQTPNMNQLPKTYADTLQDTINNSILAYTLIYQDSQLIALIDQALKTNQELNLFRQEVEIARWEAYGKRGEYLPFLRPSFLFEGEKPGRYTRNGAVEHQLEIAPETEFPEPLLRYSPGFLFSWEIDVWKRLRNLRKSAYLRYLASNEMQHYLITQLVAEVSSTYYDLMALQNQIHILDNYIELQKKILNILRTQKQAALVTELAVKRFEAEIAKNQARIYHLKQEFIEFQNQLYFLLGQYPRPIQLPWQNFLNLTLPSIKAGIPIQLITNRPDIRSAEYQLQSANIEVEAARAAFYPTFSLDGFIGLESFNPTYLIDPLSILYGWGFSLISPLINRIELKANYQIQTAKQRQAVIQYEQRLLKAYLEVLTTLAKVQNMEQAFLTRQKQVSLLQKAVSIADNLFIYAEADYLEVLLTQRDAMEAQMELIEVKKEYLDALIELYRALGGGWRNIP